ncbi:MAG TPA: class I SAM-dependent methyltransferase [Gemmatimonadaceae bacterium]|nr:class I SAM-dependent methyltransferase [Gemmatimonadaceae bacterium]
MGTSLTNEEYWIRSYGDAGFVEYEPDNDHFRLLFRYVDPEALDSVIEVGSYPAPFLAALGRYGCELNGIDFHPANATAVPAWLKACGYKVGSFFTQDFLEFSPHRKYDLAYSLGFIEHFTNFEEIILRQASLVKPGGYIFLSTPNFAGSIQKWLHYLLDRSNLEKHYLPSMNPLRWAEALERQGFEVLFAGYYGNIGFWVDPVAKRSSANRLVSKAITHLFWNIRKLSKADSRHFSVFCGLVAIRR